MVLSSWQSHCESSPGSFDECRMVPSSRRPKTKPDNLGCESACTGCQKLHPPSPFIITPLPVICGQEYRSVPVFKKSITWISQGQDWVSASFLVSTGRGGGYFLCLSRFVTNQSCKRSRHWYSLLRWRKVIFNDKQTKHSEIHFHWLHSDQTRLIVHIYSTQVQQPDMSLHV